MIIFNLKFLCLMSMIFPGVGCSYLSIDGDTLALYFSKNFTCCEDVMVKS